MNLEELKKHIRAHQVSGTPEEMRKAFSDLARPVQRAAPPGLKVSGPGYHGRLHGQYGGAPVLYFHGGGYVFGSPDTHRGLAHSLMLASRQNVLTLDYPLAPERRWPAQLNAALAGVRGLAEQYGARIIVAGDSAGGHLAVLTALRSEHVCACVSFSPNTLRNYDLTESRTGNRELDLMVDPDADDALAGQAFGTVDGVDPEQTLLLNDLAALPPLYLSVGRDEVLRDDALLLAQKAVKDGAVLTLDVREGFHLQELFAPIFGPGLAAVQKAGDWIRFTSPSSR